MSAQDQADFSDTREAATLIARESAEAAGLLAALMAHNADHLQSLQASLYEGMEAERDYWRARAEIAERRLAGARDKLMRLFDGWEPDADR